MTGLGHQIDVSVVIPHFQQQDELALTLEALNHQTHPAERLQVVVADDGSPTPVRPEISAAYDLLIRSQERDGFGLARARNLGARAAEGDVVVFLDADMLPERGFVTAHVEAVASDDYLISIGHRLHVNASGLSRADVAHAVASGGGLTSLLDGRDRSEPPWRADHLSRTNDLRDEFAEAYRIASGGNLALWRCFYWDCGGTDSGFRQWGGEDIEFAFRATQYGASFVYSRQALAWHQGLASATEEGERRSQAQQRPLLANRIADRHLRTTTGGRVFTVPHLFVEITSGAATAVEVELLTERLLRHPLGCEVHISDVAADEMKALLRAFAADPRVRVGEVETAVDAVPVTSPAPVRALLDMREVVSATAVFDAVARLSAPPRVGVVRIGSSAVYSQELAARLVRRRAWAEPRRTVLIDALAREAGEAHVDGDAPVDERAPGAALEGADVVRDLWWRLSPRQRRLVERAARTGSTGIERARRVRRHLR